MSIRELLIALLSCDAPLDSDVEIIWGDQSFKINEIKNEDDDGKYCSIKLEMA